MRFIEDKLFSNHFIKGETMKLLYKFLLTINATSWMAIIYAIKENWTIGKIPAWLFGSSLLIIPIFLSLFSLLLTKRLSKESLTECVEVSLADGEFLPVYLGYFFVSVGVAEDLTMLIVFIIVFVFTFISQTQYFNPIFLLFGYHYYHILTKNGTKIFVIKRGKVARKATELSIENLYRINDTTFIERW